MKRGKRALSDVVELAEGMMQDWGETMTMSQALLLAAQLLILVELRERD